MLKLRLCFLLLFTGATAQQTSVADSLYALGNYTAAINAYAKVGGARSQLQIARAYNAAKNNAKAILQYEAVIKADSTQLLPQFELGKLFDRTKNHKETKRIFQALTLKDPNNPEFFYYLGKAQQGLFEYDEGKKTLSKAIALDSTHLRSIYLLGKFYLSVDKYDDAHGVLDKGLRTAPEDKALINLKALAYFDRTEFKESIPYFEKLLEQGERKPFIFKKLGYAYANEAQFEEAKKTYKVLLDIPNQEADGYLGMARVFMQEKVLDSAETHFLKAIEERRYSFEEEYKNLGRIARIQNQTKKSLDYYTKAWEENKGNSFTYYQVCVLADEYYKDPKTRLNYYQRLLTDFEQVPPFLLERVKKRMGEIREEIHFDGD